MFNEKQDAVITVYIGLILSVIIALLAVSIQSASVRVSEVRMKRLLHQAMESVSASFYGPLYDKYHVFGLDGGYGAFEFDEERLEQETYRFISNNLLDSSTLLLSQAIPKEIFVTSYTTLLQDKGKQFISQAIAAMKYNSIAAITEKLLNLKKSIKDADSIQPIMDKQIEVTEELSEIDQDMRYLMEYIDGCLLVENGFKHNSKNEVITAKQFTKMLIDDSPNETNTRIHNERLFAALKPYFINTSHEITILRQCVEEAVRLELRKSQLQTELNEIRKQSEDYRRELESYLQNNVRGENEDNTDSVEDLDRMKELKERLRQLYAMEDNMLTKLTDLSSQMEQTDKKYKSVNSMINEAEKACLTQNKKALTVIGQMDLKKETAAIKLSIYEELLATSEKELSPEMYQAMKEEAEWMKNYTKTSREEGSDIAKIKAVLENQAVILTQLQNLLPSSLKDLSGDGNLFFMKLSEKQKLYSRYCLNQPEFDYSGMSKSVEEANIVKQVIDFINQGIAGLVIENYDELSEKELEGEMLPSRLSSLSKDGNFLEGIQEILQSASPRRMLSIAKTDELLPALLETGNQFTDRGFLTAYYEQHFSRYSDSKKDHLLFYELEYLLEGGNDKENISSVAGRIFSLRLVLNVLYTLSSKECRASAGAAATAAVGFTGFAALAALAKYLILIVWAMEAALVETTAIIKGKRVSFLVNKECFSVEFHELLQINKSSLQVKANAIKESKFGLTYLDYLRLFLFTAPSYITGIRAMDLIQENLNAVYSDKIYLKNTVCQYRAELSCSLPLRFIHLPVVGNYADMNKEITFYVESSTAY